MKLQWTDRARRDLLQIGQYIARDNPAAARRWIERLRDKARGASRAPLAGRVVPELGRDSVREIFLGNYRLIYILRKDVVTVLTVFEGHRLLRNNDIPDN